jgi:hypothetical protein
MRDLDTAPRLQRRRHTLDATQFLRVKARSTTVRRVIGHENDIGFVVEREQQRDRTGAFFVAKQHATRYFDRHGERVEAFAPDIAEGNIANPFGTI